MRRTTMYIGALTLTLASAMAVASVSPAAWAEAKRATTDPFDLEKLAEQELRNLRDIAPPSAIEPEFRAWVVSLEDVRTTAIAYVDASNTADRQAAGARASAAIQRVYKTQETFPLPRSCKS